jgi:hypothetical protein
VSKQHVRGKTRGIAAPVPAPVVPPPAASIRLGGNYLVEGANPDGTTYRGTAIITPSPTHYFIKWYVGSAVFSGSGTLSGQTLTIVWTDSSGRTGLIAYGLSPDGVLTGSWAGGKGSERMTPMQ